MNSFKRIALVTAAALASTFFVAIPQAQAAVTNGYVLSDSLAAGARGVTVLADTTKAEAGVNAVVVLTTSDTLAATADDNVTLEVAGPASFTDYTAAGSNPTGVTLTSLGKLFTFTATTTAAVNLPTNVKLTVNGAGTVKTNVLSVADSYVRVQDTSTAGTLTSSVDVATAVAVTNGGTGYINIRAMDAYAAQLSTSGVIQASATGGAVVAFDAAPSTQVNAVAKTGTAGVLYVVQGTANENKPVTTTVTITFNGTVLATKTITFTGRAASILVTGADIAQSNGARTGTYDFVVKDSAGNQLASITPSADTTKYTSQVTSVSVGGASSATAVQTGGWTCASTSGSATVRLSYTHTDATVIYSNDFIAACAGGVDKYTATLDKKEYKAGEIATLTISATDINGAKVHGAATLGAGVAISGGQLTAVSAATSADVFDTAGSRSIKFTVGNTAGSYNLIVDLPAYVASDSAKVVSYSVVDSSGSVSNAQILQSIVALIATINKQIAALQKLILAKR